jgi:hypothetical protein
MVLDPSALKGKLKTGEGKKGRKLWRAPFLGKVCGIPTDSEPEHTFNGAA